MAPSRVSTVPAGWETPRFNPPQRGEESRWVRRAGRLQRAINEQNPSTSGGLGTSTSTGPASASTTERETEPVSEASEEYGPRQTGSGRGGREAGREQEPSETRGSRGARLGAHQPWTASAGVHGQSLHGVEPAPTVDKGIIIKPGNLTANSLALGPETIEAVDDHRREGRSPRSSPRAGKPPTRRRGAVG